MKNTNVFIKAIGAFFIMLFTLWFTGGNKDIAWLAFLIVFWREG